MRRKGATLTGGERDVLILVARGLTNRQIAEQLSVSMSKVKALLHQACVKLGAHNRIQAVFVALRRRTINVDEVFSVDELVDLLSSLRPEAVETIAGLLRQEPDQEELRYAENQALHTEKGHGTILTRREKEVLSLVARGLSNQEIADQLCTTTSTVRTFLYQACLKLEVTTRAQAFISAVRKRAVNVDEVFSLDELVELLDSYGPEAMDTVAKLLRQKQQARIPAAR